MFPYLFSVGSEANVKQCVLFVLGRPAVYLLFISIIRNETCTFRISYNTSAASRMSQKIFRPYSAFKRWKARHRHSNREKYSSANHPRKKYSEQKTLSEKHSISVVQTATRLPSTIPQSAPLSGIFRMGHGKRVTFISWKQPASNQNVNTEIWWSCWIKVFQAKK